MQNANKTTVTEFVLLGFSNFKTFENILFYAAVLAYVVCIFGNTAIIILVRLNPSLRTPMYYFITTFAVLEIMFVSVTIPELLALLMEATKTISLPGCFIQMYALNALGETECFLLALMVLDRYLAINKPLHYSTLMTQKFCSVLAIFPWLAGFTISSIPTICTILLDYCGPNKINQFFCDLAPLQNLACSNPFFSNLATQLAAILSVVFPFITIGALYAHIISTVLKIDSSEGKQKAFSTCSSHLIVACLFYGTVIAVYIRPKGSQYDKFLALMYTVVTPPLNPFIYTLRNREVRNSLRKLTRQLLKELSLLVP
ncbi:olfactory receptor 10AG1-like [Bufo gargarizans]|uniref:olfactory receptor 10AG1-like n=1 Tax=Bufo gargarizans TaxID=30331 RepID=UPI001CF4000E|nr:olfactory receptor 10AG1-like [Bufo gargarizans]